MTRAPYVCSLVHPSVCLEPCRRLNNGDRKTKGWTHKFPHVLEDIAPLRAAVQKYLGFGNKCERRKRIEEGKVKGAEKEKKEDGLLGK